MSCTKRQLKHWGANTVIAENELAEFNFPILKEILVQRIHFQFLKI